MGQTCISDDGHEYADGASNAAGTHICHNGAWSKKLAAPPIPGLTETGKKPILIKKEIQKKK
jgi:hypothetical protein